MPSAQLLAAQGEILNTVVGVAKAAFRKGIQMQQRFNLKKRMFVMPFRRGKTVVQVSILPTVSMPGF
jgi:hypothetical protein